MQNTNFICYFCLLLPRISCLNYFLNEGKRLQDVGLGTSSNRQSDAQKTFILLSTQSERNPKIREKIESLQPIVYKPCFSIQLTWLKKCSDLKLLYFKKFTDSDSFLRSSEESCDQHTKIRNFWIFAQKEKEADYIESCLRFLRLTWIGSTKWNAKRCQVADLEGRENQLNIRVIAIVLNKMADLFLSNSRKMVYAG